MNTRLLYGFIMIVATSIVAVISLASCGSSKPTDSLRGQPCGEMDIEQAIEYVESRRIIGDNLSKVIDNLGPAIDTDKYSEYDYVNIIGTCDTYAPAYRWLLIHIADDVVIDARFECD